jgi:hypothetical protein
MIQVLCQILQTDNLVDVQSWLVSASDADKEKVKTLIDHAMKGLEEAGRIELSNNNNNNDLIVLQSNDGNSFDKIENTLQK